MLTVHFLVLGVTKLIFDEKFKFCWFLIVYVIVLEVVFLSNSLLVQLFVDVDADSWMCIMQLWCSACSAAVGHPGIQCL